MRDPANPTKKEIDEWARTPGAAYPLEDWDLTVATNENAELLFRLAADPKCTNHDAVLNFLYVYAGQAVREGLHSDTVATLRKVIDRATAIGPNDLRLWARRAADALEGRGPDPRPNRGGDGYRFWFGGGWRGGTG